MNFELKDEQYQLQETLRRMLNDHYSFEARQRHAGQKDGWSISMWNQLAQLGVLSLPFPEQYGGFDGDGTDIMLVMENFGRVMILEPYLATVVLAGTALRLAGSPQQCSETLSDIMQGKMLLAFAHTEWEGREHLSTVATTARQGSDGRWQIHGTKCLVLHGGSAHHWVVTARTAGDKDDENGLGLFLVDADATGAVINRYRLIDQTPAADITFHDVTAQPLGVPGQAWPIIRQVINAGIAAVCAQAVGAMNAALDLTVDYLKTREQFGRTIGSNQSLQHRAAEMLAATEQARSMAMLASMMADDPADPSCHHNLALAKILVGRESCMVGQQAIQLHGGIGMTEEYAVGHFLRHLTVLDQIFGDSAFHLRQITQ